MASLSLHIPVLDHTDPQYCFDLLTVLSCTMDYLERISNGNEKDTVILTATKCIEHEIERITHYVVDSGLIIPQKFHPTVLIDIDGSTVELALGHPDDNRNHVVDRSHLN